MSEQEPKCFKSLTSSGAPRLVCANQVGIKHDGRWELYRIGADGIEIFERYASAKDAQQLDLILTHGWHE